MPRTCPTIRRLSYHFGSTSNIVPAAARAYSSAPSASSSIMAPTASAASSHLKPTELASQNAPRGSMAATTAVSKIPGRSALPDEAVSNPHHLLKRGSVVGFKNPYPSCASSPNFGTMVRKIWWYVMTLPCIEYFVPQKLTDVGPPSLATSRNPI